MASVCAINSAPPFFLSHFNSLHPGSWRTGEVQKRVFSPHQLLLDSRGYHSTSIDGLGFEWISWVPPSPLH